MTEESRCEEPIQAENLLSSGASIDLTNCDREPIHIPGAIQPHGVLVVCRTSDLQITYVSENVSVLLKVSAASLLGASIGSLFPPEESATRATALVREVTDGKPVYLFTVRLQSVKTIFDAIAHRNGDFLFLELEPAVDNRNLTAPELYRLVQRSLVNLQKSGSVDQMTRACVAQVRQISGFDRVMLYRFDAEWNGEVVAEDRREDLEPFLGLHYPASDIPSQARELYTKNWLRFIPDRAYSPSRVLAAGATEDKAAPLDMSFSVLRSVSPIHIEYLRNMGVGASMSVSLIRDGKLWGLIACHHSSARFVPYDVRTACELLGQMMSLFLDSAERKENADQRTAMVRVNEALLANVEQFDDTHKALIDFEPNLLGLIESDGAALVVGDRVSRLGQTPGEDDIRKLSVWIAQNVKDDVFATDNLQVIFGSGILVSVASGMLAVCITTDPTHLFLWFRPEQVRTIDWAGDPKKLVVKGDGGVRLSPRGSFALWKEIVKGRSKPWKAVELEIAQFLHDGVMRRLLRRTERLTTAHTSLRLASDEREKILESERSARTEAERLSRMKDEFVATLSHELRTPLNAILGWAQILVQTSGLDEEVAEAAQIIERNARSQAQMIEDLLEVSRIISGKLRLDMQNTHLPSVIDAAIDTVGLAAVAKDIRIEKLVDPLIGLETTGDPGRLQQVVWNLLSNAVKFTPKGGKIQVVLERIESHVELSITDSGLGIEPDFLPYVFERFRQADGASNRKHGGLGLGLSIVRNLVELHGGTVRAQSAGKGRGSTFTVALPVRAVQALESEPRIHPRANAIRAEYPIIDLTGVKVLVVDDESDARQLVKRILVDCHAQIVTAASKVDALSVLAREHFDVIVADIGMPGGDGFEFIREWRDSELKSGATKTPAVALTAYARAEDRQRVILAGFQAHVAKPVEAGELIAIVASLSGRVR